MIFGIFAEVAVRRATSIASMIAGRSMLSRFSSSVSLRWPSASIGTFSALAIVETLIRDPVPARRVRHILGSEMQVGSLVFGGGIIGLQRPNFKRVAAQRPN